MKCIMMKKIYKTLVIAAIVTTFASGCRTTKEYKQFAEAGDNFVKATDTLLEKAGEIKVNETSERVLKSRREILQINNKEAPNDIVDNNNRLSEEDSNDIVAMYKELSEEDKKRLEIIKELRKHNKFLQQYFKKLLELAKSDSPDKTKTAIENIATQLRESNSKIINLNIIEKVPPVTGIVLDARIRGALRKELEKRKETIYQEIILQEKALTYISSFMEEDIKKIRDFQEQRLLIEPLKSENIDGNIWIEERYKILTQDGEIIPQINNAIDSLRKFKAIFIDSMEGEITSKRLNNFIQETNSFSTIVFEQK